MRRLLDLLYGAAMAAACLCMVAIAALVAVQVGGRMLDRVLIWTGGSPVGIQVPSLAEIGAFLFVGAAFLALPATLRAGGHVRVTVALKLAGPKVGRVLTGLVLALALALALFAAWHSGAQAADSHAFNSMSFGRVRIPLWIPQAVMTAGLGLFALALADELWELLRGRHPAFRAAELGREEDGL